MTVPRHTLLLPGRWLRQWWQHTRQLMFGALPPVSFVAGVCVLQTQAALPAAWWAVVLLLPIVWLAYQPSRIALCFLFFALGFFYAAARAEWRLAEQLPAQFHNTTIGVEGKVLTTPHDNGKRARFEILLTKMTAPVTATLNLRARLSDYHRGKPNADIIPGTRIRFQTRVRPPTSFFNPHGFDYAGNAFAKNIRLVGYVRERETMETLQPGGDDIRYRLAQRLAASGAPKHPLLAALIIGERGGMTQDDWTLLRRTGTAHLFSISGLHIGYIFLLMSLLAGLFWRLPGVYHRAPKSKLAALVALPFAFGYAWLSSFGIPVQRSFLVALAGVLIILSGGIVSAKTVLALVLLLITLIHPWAVLLPGFWLSFAFAGILCFMVINHNPAAGLLRQLISAQLLLSLFAIPLTLWFFNEASLISPLANTIAIPVITMAVLPTALLGIAGGDWLWQISGTLLGWLWQCMAVLSALPYAAHTPAQSPAWVFALAVGGVVWMLMPRGVPYRFLGVLPAVAMLFAGARPPPPAHLQAVFLDVGQGNAAVLRTHSHTVVYDTGRAFGGQIVGDYLRGEGIGRIDTLIISHDNDDHRGGLPYLRANFDIGEVVDDHSGTVCTRGDRWVFDGVVYDVLHPPQPHSYNTNDSSCVIRVQTPGGRALLLTGDISHGVEQELAAGLAPGTVMLVAHHGSRFSGDAGFIAAYDPDIAVISVGRNNYGHPHPDTLARLKGREIWRTDHNGAIIIDMSDTTTTRGWRQSHLRYWH